MYVKLGEARFPCILLISLWHRTFSNYYAALNQIYCRVVDFALETRYNRHIPSLLKPAVYNVHVKSLNSLCHNPYSMETTLDLSPLTTMPLQGYFMAHYYKA